MADDGDLQSRLLKGEDPIGGLEGGDKSQVQNSEIQYLFSPDRDQFPSKPYHEDGNPEMYTKENLMKRQQLYRNDVVEEAINDFMKEFKMNSQGQVSKDEYERVFISVAMILRPGIDTDSLGGLIKEAFESDTSDSKNLFVTEEDQKAQAEQEMN